MKNDSSSMYVCLLDPTKANTFRRRPTPPADCPTGIRRATGIARGLPPVSTLACKHG